MKFKTIAATAAAFALSLTLSACGGTSAGSIAKDVCNITEEMQSLASTEGATPDDLRELRNQLDELREKAEKAHISDADMQSAMEKECGDLL